MATTPNRNLTTPGATALSKDLVGKLISGIGESRSQTVIPGGKPLMRLTRDGWVFGMSDDAVQEGSSWQLNPLSISHGYVSWTRHNDPKQKDSLVGEVMVPVFEAKPAKPEPVDGEWPFTEQRSVDMKCLDGDDKGIEVQYKNSSIGGLRAFDGLLSAIQSQLQTNPAFPCPIVQLGIDSYRHQKYGPVSVPVFEIVGWGGMDGSPMPANGGAPNPPPAAAEAEAEEAPRQRRTKAPLARTKPAAAPEPTARRRPVRW